LFIGVHAVDQGLRWWRWKDFSDRLSRVFEMGIAYVFWLKAMKLSSDTAKIANLIFISPFLSLFFIHFLVGETILPATFIGLLCIIVGLVLQSRANKAERGRG
jgi:drug/metabolite transporter (DMT)-like permease